MHTWGNLRPHRPRAIVRVTRSAEKHFDSPACLQLWDPAVGEGALPPRARGVMEGPAVGTTAPGAGTRCFCAAGGNSPRTARKNTPIHSTNILYHLKKITRNSTILIKHLSWFFRVPGPSLAEECYRALSTARTHPSWLTGLAVRWRCLHEDPSPGLPTAPGGDGLTPA